MDSEDVWERIDSELKKLQDYRVSRTKIHKDDEILLSWNTWVLITPTMVGHALEESLVAVIRKHFYRISHN